jgi:hypothetical protein
MLSRIRKKNIVVPPGICLYSYIGTDSNTINYRHLPMLHFFPQESVFSSSHTLSLSSFPQSLGAKHPAPWSLREHLNNPKQIKTMMAIKMMMIVITVNLLFSECNGTSISTNHGAINNAITQYNSSFLTSIWEVIIPRAHVVVRSCPCHHMWTEVKVCSCIV